MSVAIEVYCNKRLRGKQPDPNPGISERKTISVRGHYDVLGVLRTATAAEIHAAYRRRALATHPDKGGDPKDFRRVKLAFEELVDAAKRAAYDRSLVLFGRRDGMAAEASKTGATNTKTSTAKKSTEKKDYGAARVAYCSLLASKPESWRSTLETMADEIVKGLADILKGSKSLQAPADAGAQANASGVLSGWQGPTCISQHASKGYKVTVSWAEISVSTSFTKSLTQSIDWQIALLSMQSTAQLRMKRRAQSESKEPLTEQEVFQVLEKEPALDLTFAIKVKKVAVANVPDLRLALQIRSRLLKAAAGKNPDAGLKASKREAEQEVAKAKKSRQSCSHQLLVAVNQELEARKSPSSRRRAASKALVMYDESDAKNRKRKATSQPPAPKHRRICDGKVEGSTKSIVVVKANVKDNVTTLASAKATGSGCKASQRGRRQVATPARKQRA